MTLKIVGNFSVREEPRIRKIFAQLPADCTNDLKGAISESGEELRFAMLTRVPVRTGALAASIGLKLAKDGMVAFVGFSRKEFPRQWKKPYVGWLANIVEFGTKATTGLNPAGVQRLHRKGALAGKAVRAHAATRAQPFVYPALRDKAPAIIELHKAAVADALNRAGQIT